MPESGDHEANDTPVVGVPAPHAIRHVAKLLHAHGFEPECLTEADRLCYEPRCALSCESCGTVWLGSKGGDLLAVALDPAGHVLGVRTLHSPCRTGIRALAHDCAAGRLYWGADSGRIYVLRRARPVVQSSSREDPEVALSLHRDVEFGITALTLYDGALFAATREPSIVRIVDDRVESIPGTGAGWMQWIVVGDSKLTFISRDGNLLRLARDGGCWSVRREALSVLPTAATSYDRGRGDLLLGTTDGLAFVRWEGDAPRLVHLPLVHAAVLSLDSVVLDGDEHILAGLENNRIQVIQTARLKAAIDGTSQGSSFHWPVLLPSAPLEMSILRHRTDGSCSVLVGLRNHTVALYRFRAHKSLLREAAAQLTHAYGLLARATSDSEGVELLGSAAEITSAARELATTSQACRYLVADLILPGLSSRRDIFPHDPWLELICAIIDGSDNRALFRLARSLASLARDDTALLASISVRLLTQFTRGRQWGRFAKTILLGIGSRSWSDPRGAIELGAYLRKYVLLGATFETKEVPLRGLVKTNDASGNQLDALIYCARLYQRKYDIVEDAAAPPDELAGVETAAPPIELRPDSPRLTFVRDECVALDWLPSEGPPSVAAATIRHTSVLALEGENALVLCATDDGGLLVLFAGRFRIRTLAHTNYGQTITALAVFRQTASSYIVCIGTARGDMLCADLTILPEMAGATVTPIWRDTHDGTVRSLHFWNTPLYCTEARRSLDGSAFPVLLAFTSAGRLIVYEPFDLHTERQGIGHELKSALGNPVFRGIRYDRVTAPPGTRRIEPRAGTPIVVAHTAEGSVAIALCYLRDSTSAPPVGDLERFYAKAAQSQLRSWSGYEADKEVFKRAVLDLVHLERGGALREETLRVYARSSDGAELLSNGARLVVELARLRPDRPPDRRLAVLLLREFGNALGKVTEPEEWARRAAPVIEWLGGFSEDSPGNARVRIVAFKALLHRLPPGVSELVASSGVRVGIALVRALRGALDSEQRILRVEVLRSLSMFFRQLPKDARAGLSWRALDWILDALAPHMARATTDRIEPIVGDGWYVATALLGFFLVFEGEILDVCDAMLERGLHRGGFKLIAERLHTLKKPELAALVERFYVVPGLDVPGARLFPPIPTPTVVQKLDQVCCTLERLLEERSVTPPQAGPGGLPNQWAKLVAWLADSEDRTVPPGLLGAPRLLALRFAVLKEEILRRQPEERDIWVNDTRFTVARPSPRGGMMVYPFRDGLEYWTIERSGRRAVGELAKGLGALPREVPGFQVTDDGLGFIVGTGATIADRILATSSDQLVQLCANALDSLGRILWILHRRDPPLALFGKVRDRETEFVRVVGDGMVVHTDWSKLREAVGDDLAHDTVVLGRMVRDILAGAPASFTVRYLTARTHEECSDVRTFLNRMYALPLDAGRRDVKISSELRGRLQQGRFGELVDKDGRPMHFEAEGLKLDPVWRSAHRVLMGDAPLDVKLRLTEAFVHSNVWLFGLEAPEWHPRSRGIIE